MTTTSTGKEMEQLESFSITGKNMNVQSLWKSLADLQKVQQLSHDFSNSTHMFIPRRTKSMLIAALFIIAKKWKQLKYSLACEWKNNMWHIHSVEYYSARKKNEVLIHATAWMNLENIMQGKKARHKRPHTV